MNELTIPVTETIVEETEENTMPNYGVGLANFFDNDLNVYVVEAESFREAIIKVRLGIVKGENIDNTMKWLQDLPRKEEEIKKFFFNADELVGWTELETEELK